MARKGQIALFAGDFTPKGWALCDGKNGTPNIPNLVDKNGNTIPYFIATEDDEDFYMGFVYLTATTFAPKTWLVCDGQILNKSDNTAALFSIIGTKYGGDGITNVALPKLERFQSSNVGSMDSSNHEDNYISYMIHTFGIFPERS
jgi:microcystin-dependent protein